MTFFRSRWVQAQVHVKELEPAALPAGFRAGAAAAGLKAEGLDVGVLASEQPETVSAARFTAAWNNPAVCVDKISVLYSCWCNIIQSSVIL